jgi:methylmalonyl-CoA mutase C-terminal domain/subunit
MTSETKIRILMAKMGVDGHELGVLFVSRGLRDRGVEVIYLGMFQIPEKVVSSAIQEDVDIIGISSIGGDHFIHLPRMMDLLKGNNANIPVIVGGVIPQEDIPGLKEIGIKEVFLPASTIDSIASCIEELVKKT